jgi:hypothetical protein
MEMLGLSAVAAISLLALTAGSPDNAESAARTGEPGCEIAIKYQKETRTAENWMLEARQVLLDKERDEWTTAEIQDFESSSLWVVYTATMSYQFEHKMNPPAEFQDLVEQSYVEHWPENPYNNWKPVEVLAFEDGFSAGNLAYAPAPEDYRDGKHVGAFEMVIYGPDIEFAAHGSIKPVQLEDWVVVPEGALYMLGSG